METSDHALASLAAAGDRRAFSELVRRHQGVVRGLVRRLAGDPGRGDDIAQDAFIKAWDRIGDWRGEGSVKSWLCRIAYTEFLMSARKAKTRARLEADAGSELDVETQQPDSVAKVALDRALAQLAPDERACVVLCYAAGMSHGEAAAATGLPLGTVKSHVNRGRARLRALLDPDVDGRRRA